MTFNAEHLTQAFELMALGMGGVFPSIRILYAVSAILLKAFPPGKERSMENFILKRLWLDRDKKHIRLGMVNGSG